MFELGERVCVCVRLTQSESFSQEVKRSSVVGKTNSHTRFHISAPLGIQKPEEEPHYVTR